MIHDTTYIKTRYSLQAACNALSAAYWTGCPYRAQEARTALMDALCGYQSPSPEFLALLDRAVPMPAPSDPNL
jgi:hypothetical protein